MYLTYRQALKMNSKETNIRQPGMQGLYRVLVAIGVIFAIILIVVYLNTLIIFNIGNPSTVNALLETQKNFLTIIGTAFASLIFLSS
jgi:hypothetical protein